MAESGVSMGTEERAEVDTIADCGDGADGRGGWRGETTVLRAFFFSDLGTDGFEATVERLML
jgi:hypothetical protein